MQHVSANSLALHLGVTRFFPVALLRLPAVFLSRIIRVPPASRLPQTHKAFDDVMISIGRATRACPLQHHYDRSSLATDGVVRGHGAEGGRRRLQATAVEYQALVAGASKKRERIVEGIPETILLCAKLRR